MSVQVTHSVWLNEIEVCSAEHLAEVSGLSIDEVRDLINSGIIEPTGHGVQPEAFQLQYVITVKTARRLRDDFQLNREGVALALTLLRRIGKLEVELKTLQT